LRTSKSIRFHEVGGPEVLKLEEVAVAAPAAHEVLVRHESIGVNFIDTYYRSGLYASPLPSVVGSEAAGVVEAVGSGVTEFKVGDRVAYCTGPLGSYAERRVIDERFLVKVPDGVSFSVAASSMLKGLTVHYLFNSVHKLKSGEAVLFHAAAGGVGLIACQWARHLGAKLIGTVSSDEKAKVARDFGAWETINYSRESVVDRVAALTQGAKVPVVYDSVGKSTWEASLDCLAPMGLLVSYGNASGPVTGVNLATLAQKGSLFVTRPVLGHYVSTPELLRAAASDLFSLIEAGHISAGPVKELPLADAAIAHQELSDRHRIGALVLRP
jgi:NADPH2:quinone reductase